MLSFLIRSSSKFVGILTIPCSILRSFHSSSNFALCDNSVDSVTVEFVEFIFGSLLGVTLTFPHPFADAPAGAMDTALSLLLGRFARRGGARLPPPELTSLLPLDDFLLFFSG